MADAAIHGHDHEDDRGFFTRWFMSTNHKDIGILYLFVSGFVGFISVAFTVYMRLELMEPGVQYMCLEGARFIANAAAECTPNGHLWNVMITYHGVLMMFFVVIPALFGGFGNYFMPLQIGAPVCGWHKPWCGVNAGTGWQRPTWVRRRLGALPAAVHIRGRHVHGPCDLCGAPVGCLVDPWRDQHDHDIPEHAHTGHDIAQGSTVRLVDLCHRLVDPSGPARFGWCDHNVADRP